MAKKKVKVVCNPFGMVEGIVSDAIERGMNRCDKYSAAPLTDGQRDLLRREILASFWIFVEDNGVSFV